MADYCFHAEGTNGKPKTVEAKKFLKALADENCKEIHLMNCAIEGRVDIGESEISPDKNGKYPINIPVRCEGEAPLGLELALAMEFGLWT